MSSAYNRLKKHRQIKRSIEKSKTSRDMTDVDQNIFDNLDSSIENSDRSPDCSSLSSMSSNSDQSSESDTDTYDALPVKELNLREKLQGWAVRHRSNLTVQTIEDLLEVLSSENIMNLPKSATTLLQTRPNKNIKCMTTSKNTIGSYIYVGIEKGLKEIITDEYTENIIHLLFNVDGLPLFNSSNQQFWTNLGLILHNDYESQPFIVALYCGDSKPVNVDDFLEDYVIEARNLIQNGITIGQIKFKVEVVGFSCDTPARSFIKKCKGHGGFYACERCETRGITKNRKRVYPSMKSRRRTKVSFTRKRQFEHHLEGKSPLLNIPGFDPVRSVFLDSMHLLYLGIMKWILQQFLGTKYRVNRKCKLSHCNVRQINSSLKLLVRFIPKEFQRKKFDFNEFSHWKATQFRFFLHYCGVLVLRNNLPKQVYRHFLLLVVACRLLCDPQLCVPHVNYAKQLLKKFFELLPSFYGSDSQVMNCHNLIHLADDVEFTKKNLCAISAFPFENCLGKIKREIKGRNNPLAQLIRRMSEQNACPEMVKKNSIHKKKYLIVNSDPSNEDEPKSIILHGVELSSAKPNNVVKLVTGEIFDIKVIKRDHLSIFLHGYVYKNVVNAFTYPCESIKVGIMQLGELTSQERVISLEDISKKCVFFNDGLKNFAVTYLHTT